MFNKVTLIGRLTKNPDVRYTPSGLAVARFTLAISRPSRNKEEKPVTDFIRIVAWRKLAEICSQYIFKGKLIAVEGRLQVEKYERAEGQTDNIYEVIADNIQMLDKKSDSIRSADDSSEHATNEVILESSNEEDVVKEELIGR